MPTQRTSTIWAPLPPTALAKWTCRALIRSVGRTVSFSGPSITSSRPVASFTAAIMAGLYWSMFSSAGAASPANASSAENTTTATPVRIQVRFCMANNS